MKQIPIISDLHCGSAYGLVPPRWWQKHEPSHYTMQKECWKRYTQRRKAWKKPDILIINGDCVDGNQHKQGGAELLTTDRNVQAEMAVQCIQGWEPKKILMTFGSRYHVSEGAEDFEYIVYKLLLKSGYDVEIGGKLFFKAEGLVFDCRHKVSSSVIPHGKATPLLREVLWNHLKASLDEEPRADVVIRSHAHYYLYVEQLNRVAIITPALQVSRGRYGSRECSGETTWGLIRLTINNGKIIGRDKDISPITSSKPKLITL